MVYRKRYDWRGYRGSTDAWDTGTDRTRPTGFFYCEFSCGVSLKRVSYPSYLSQQRSQSTRRRVAGFGDGRHTPAGHILKRIVAISGPGRHDYGEPMTNPATRLLSTLRHRWQSDEGGVAVREMVAIAAIGIILLAVVLATLQVAGVDVDSWLRDQFGLSSG